LVPSAVNELATNSKPAVIAMMAETTTRGVIERLLISCPQGYPRL
jgi:hypothetical protein